MQLALLLMAVSAVALLIGLTVGRHVERRCAIGLLRDADLYRASSIAQISLSSLEKLGQGQSDEVVRLMNLRLDSALIDLTRVAEAPQPGASQELLVHSLRRVLRYRERCPDSVTEELLEEAGLDAECYRQAVAQALATARLFTDCHAV